MPSALSFLTRRPTGRSRSAGFLWLAVLTGLATSVLPAQRPFTEPPKRPKLPAQADSNSAHAYYNLGLEKLASDPGQASRAFYWATRLDPTWGAPLYAEATALLLARAPEDLERYLLRRDEALRNPEVRQIDSLTYQAVLRNPFVDRRLDGVLLTTWLQRVTGTEITVRELGRYDRRFTAWAAYGRGDLKMARSVFDELIQHSPRDPDLRYWLALTRFAQGELDSARITLEESLALERENEQDVLGYGWISHASTEYGIGLLFSMVRQPDSARAAFERALLEDVTLHPAHQALARARLQARDTAGALSEYAQAVALSPRDAGYLTEMGLLLVSAGQADSGITLLRRATTEEPWFALPHFSLGLLYEQAGLRDDAVAQFRAFLSLAPQVMAPAIGAARRHLDALGAAP